MKKISFKKVIASAAALSLAAVGMAAVPASAKEVNVNGIDKTAAVYIDQVTVTLDEAKSGIPIYVRINNVFGDTGLNAFEFGVEVDDRCTFALTTSSSSAIKIGGEEISYAPQYKKSTLPGKENFTWMAGANSVSFYEPDDFGMIADPLNVALIVVTITDPQPGETYTINHAEEGVVANDDTGESEARPHLFKMKSYDHIAAGNVKYVDGWIKIEGEATTTTTQATTTTTQATTTTTTTQATTTTTEETTTTSGSGSLAPDTTTSAPTTTTTGAGTTTTGAGTTTTGAGTTTASGSSTGSPATGGSDVLPIAGAAAAVAVLGGVALVAKKKND